MSINPSNAAQPLGPPGPAARVEPAAHKHPRREEAMVLVQSSVQSVYLSLVCQRYLSAGRGVCVSDWYVSIVVE